MFFFGPAIIAALRIKQGKGQPIREDGPASHLLTKKGTPTMGGLMILSGLLVATLLWANLKNPYVWIVILVTAGFGAIGFYDDYLKVTKQSHKGFSGRARLALELLVAALACYAMMRIGGEQHRPSSRCRLVKGFAVLARLVLPRLRRLRRRRGRQFASISPTGSTASPSCRR